MLYKIKNDMVGIKAETYTYRSVTPEREEIDWINRQIATKPFVTLTSKDIRVEPSRLPSPTTTATPLESFRS